MRQLWIVPISIALSLSAATQEDAQKPRLSDDSLTPEQVAVYRAVLKDYTKKSDAKLNLANKTEPLDQSSPMFDKGCFSGIQTDTTQPSGLVVHRIDPTLVLNTRMTLVDPDQQRQTIEENDPQNLVKKAIDDGEKVTDVQLDRSVKKAFESGLFTLSEIVFDKEHHRAVVGYSFACGSLCGHGNTLVLKKVGKEWRVTKPCAGWVS
jgi:hypothetical protein